jgi:hypoxanthine phosphoribosyltransferase
MEGHRPHHLKFIAPSWDSIFSKSVTLAEKIRGGNPGSRFDTIVGVSRGGLVLARLMSDLLDVQDVRIVKCEYYSDVGKTLKRPTITQKIQGEIRGKRVILVDDVADTGESLGEITKYLRSKKPSSLAVATLYLKPWSKTIPDFFAAKTDAWIIFPWERYEAIKLLSKNNGRSVLKQTKIPKAIVKRLQKWIPNNSQT